MGLLFQMPVEFNENDDRIKLVDKKLTIKSYGLPMIFWGYLAAIFCVLFFMILAIKGPLLHAINGEDFINRIIAVAVLLILVLAPLALLAIFFYEKVIEKNHDSIRVIHRIFFIPIKIDSIDVKEGLILEHFMDSPNMASKRADPNLKGFENRGYFKLIGLKENQKNKNKRILIDRNSRKGEMKKLKVLLEQSF